MITYVVSLRPLLGWPLLALLPRLEHKKLPKTKLWDKQLVAKCPLALTLMVAKKQPLLPGRQRAERLHQSVRPSPEHLVEAPQWENPQLVESQFDELLRPNYSPLSHDQLQPDLPLPVQQEQLWFDQPLLAQLNRHLAEHHLVMLLPLHWQQNHLQQQQKHHRSTPDRPHPLVLLGEVLVEYPLKVKYQPRLLEKLHSFLCTTYSHSRRQILF